MRIGRRGWLVLLGLIPLVFGLTRLRFDVEVLDLLPGDLPAVQGLRAYQRNFAGSRELLVTIHAPDAESAEAAAQSLALSLRTNAAVNAGVTWTPPWLEHPVQAAELIAFLWLNQPPETFGELTNRLAPDTLAATLDAARERLATSLAPDDIARSSYDPYGLTRLPAVSGAALPDFGGGQGLFASADGTFRVLFVHARTNLAGYRGSLAWFRQVRRGVEEWRSGADLADRLTIHFTGQPAFMSEIGGRMEGDMTASALGTMVVIALLFWWAHRSLRPLVGLLTLLAAILLATLALGGLLFGTLNIVSAGFTAVLLGLAVDYGLVLYQEAKARPGASAAQIRRNVGPSIAWAALTTGTAFAVLNLSTLPGLAQLGSLVALGLVLAAVVMTFGFLPWTLAGTALRVDVPSETKAGSPPAVGSSRGPWLVTVAVAVVAVGVLSSGLPGLDRSARALRPSDSPAYAALEEVKHRLGGRSDPFWLIVSGDREEVVARKLEATSRVVERARVEGGVAGFTLPTALWPRPENQSANRAAAQILLSRAALLRETAAQRGFATNALALTEGILSAWQRASSQEGTFWPSGGVADWIFDQATSRQSGRFHALGLIYPGDKPREAFHALAAALPSDGVWLTSWEMLGEVLLGRLWPELRLMSAVMLLLVLGSLALAFRRPAEMVLSCTALAFSIVGLLVVMKLAGWSWNLMNLIAVPLLLGTGVDYSLYLQLALRRHHGDVRETRRTVGRALWLCAGTTVTGFGSLVWSGNAGLASLGRVCALGIALSLLTSLYLLPTWWRVATRRRNPPPPAAPAASADPREPLIHRPSRLYRAWVWRLGLVLIRFLPAWVCGPLGRVLGLGFWASSPKRRRIVVDNLLPALGGDRARAASMARSLFAHFGVKIADLWRYESGRRIESWFLELTGTEHFAAAVAERRGLLLVTPHLGNWEFGAPLMARRGLQVLAVTQAEPDRALTNLRVESRSRWGIETLVIQEDPFAFLEVIRRLDAGGSVALLVDRPHPATSVRAQLFGRPILASLAPAELARATGCVILPVCVVRRGGGYVAQVLPAVSYTRASLRQFEARVQLTQAILRAFEPIIRQHPDQWYHFVPIWPSDSAGGP
jgi:uncharacterized protein